MSIREEIALKAKIKVANHYLNEKLRTIGVIDRYDVLKVVTPAMRPNVVINDPATMGLTLLAGDLEFIQYRRGAA